jgi:hypothetical protein
MALSHPSRRLFATLSLVGATLWYCKVRDAFACQKDAADSKLDGQLAGLTAMIAELACAERLGHACVRGLASSGRSARELVEFLLADLGPATNYYSVRQLKNAVRKRIRKDFEEHKIVVIDGWLLSLTETQLYAIAFLRRDSG